MICKIQPANANILAAVEYNEKKMDGDEGIRPLGDGNADVKAIENGHVLATRNVPGGSSLTDEFTRLKRLNDRVRTRGAVKNPTFHMSVNPSADDKTMDEATAVRLIDELMKGLGYGDQPYRIYKHTDIAREHYHVVASRIGQDGQKINDSYERLKLRNKLKELAPKYGFSVILGEEELEEDARKTAEAKIKEFEAKQPAAFVGASKKGKEIPKKDHIPSFSRKNGTSVTEQLKDIFEDSMKWSFTTFEQLQALMLRRYRVLIEIEKGEEGGDRLVISGTNADGEPITAPISETDLGLKMTEEIRKKCTETRMSEKKQQRRRLEGLAEAAAADSGTYEEFVANMERKGVYVVVSWNRDGEPFGVTWLDRATKCAWKGSETERTMAWLKETARKKGWEITRDKFAVKDVAGRRATMPSRKKTIEIPQRPVEGMGGSGRGLTTALRNAGHTRGSSAQAGKDGKDIFDEALEERLREEQRQNNME